MSGSLTFYIVFFGTEFLAIGFDSIVLTCIGCSMVAGVVMGMYGLPEKGSFCTSCTVNVAHVFACSIGAGFLLSCHTSMSCNFH